MIRFQLLHTQLQFWIHWLYQILNKADVELGFTWVTVNKPPFERKKDQLFVIYAESLFSRHELGTHCWS